MNTDYLTDYLTDLVKKYFSTVFFLWVLGNILLRLIIKKKKKKKKRKGKKGKKGGWAMTTWSWDATIDWDKEQGQTWYYHILCWIAFIFTLGHVNCWGDDWREVPID